MECSPPTSCHAPAADVAQGFVIGRHGPLAAGRIECFAESGRNDPGAKVSRERKSAGGSSARVLGASAPIPGVPGKRTLTELIGHELTHVVQQRKGRVVAPQGKGGMVHADPELEAEAATLGAKAARGAVANVAGGASPKADVVQCKIGFEFQIAPSQAWWVTGDPSNAKMQPQQIGNPDRERIAKSIPMLQANGFELQADDSSTEGISELEIVSDAFEEDAAGADALHQALVRIAKLGEKLEALPRYECIPTTELSGFGNVTSQDHLMALGNFRVSPQVTAAIRLDQLVKVAKDFAQPDSLPGETRKEREARRPGRAIGQGGHSRLGDGVTLALQALTRYKANHGRHDWTPSNEIKGLLGLLVSYLLVGASPLSAYPKTIAPLLSRTPLDVLFSLLPSHEQLMFAPAELVRLVQAAVPDLDLDAPLFAGIYDNDQRFLEKRQAFAGQDLKRILDPLTRRLWILSIPIKDLLTSQTFADAFHDPAAGAELESLGAWKQPGEAGPEHLPSGIFELRTLNRIEFQEIPMLATVFYQYLVALNKQKNAYLKPWWV